MSGTCISLEAGQSKTKSQPRSGTRQDANRPWSSWLEAMLNCDTTCWEMHDKAKACEIK